MTQEKDYVYRRIVVEYGRLYAYVYMTDQDGKVLEEESFKQPFRLDFKDVKEEAKECFDNTYQWLQDTILWYATARDEDEEGNSEEPPEE